MGHRVSKGAGVELSGKHFVERLHDRDVDLHGLWAAQYRRQHRHALLGEGIGCGAPTAPS